MVKSKFFVFFIIVTSIIFSSPYARAENNKTIKIAAGSVLEGYYFIGLKLCKYINRSNNNIRCDVVPTSGTLENIKLLANGDVDFAFAQSNLALDAYYGKGRFAHSKPFKEMLQLLRLHDEALTVIVKDKDKILTFGQLDGKNISNGPANSDSSIIYSDLISYYNFKNQPNDIELYHEAYGDAFCNGQIDAIIMITGHPNALVNYITHKCESDFLTVESDKISRLVKSNPAFKSYIIDQPGYPGITKSETTVAIPAILITRNSVSKDLIHNFMDYFKDKVEQFKSSDPLLYDLKNDHFTSDFILPGFNTTD